MTTICPGFSAGASAVRLEHLAGGAPFHRHRRSYALRAHRNDSPLSSGQVAPVDPFWLFREGLYRETNEPRWFVHGFFA